MFPSWSVELLSQGKIVWEVQFQSKNYVISSLIKNDSC